MCCRPDGLNWLCYLAGSSKSHLGFFFLHFFEKTPHQLGIKEIVKCWKGFLWYRVPDLKMVGFFSSYCLSSPITNVYGS